MSLFEKITESVIDLDSEKTAELTEKALEEGYAPLDIVDKGLVPGIKEIGERFGRGEAFLPELMTAAKAFKNSFEILGPRLKKEDYEPRGCVVVGTVKDDIHDIGKNIVIALLQGNAYEVTDLGVDISKEKFVEKVKELEPDFLGLSCLLTTTMSRMKEVIEALDEEGVRNDVKIIVGGAPITEEFAEEIGADAYGENAQKAVEMIENTS